MEYHQQLGEIASESLEKALKGKKFRTDVCSARLDGIPDENVEYVVNRVWLNEDVVMLDVTTGSRNYNVPYGRHSHDTRVG